jgi:hypothetical protein
MYHYLSIILHFTTYLHIFFHTLFSVMTILIDFLDVFIILYGCFIFNKLFIFTFQKLFIHFIYDFTLEYLNYFMHVNDRMNLQTFYLIFPRFIALKMIIFRFPILLTNYFSAFVHFSLFKLG